MIPDRSGALHFGLRELGRESSRYLLVSGFALCCDLAVYATLIFAGLTAAAAGAVGYAVGLIVHYVLSAWWVFPDREGRRRTVPTLAKFVATGLIGLTLTSAVIGVLTRNGLMGAFTAKGIAVAFSYVAVFMLRRAYVFTAGIGR